jgi:hypothetical protein
MKQIRDVIEMLIAGKYQPSGSQIQPRYHVVLALFDDSSRLVQYLTTP